MDDVSMDCAGCGGALNAFTHRGIALDRCADCRAVWFDAREALAYLHGSPIGAKVESGAATTADDDARPCPRCREETCRAHEVRGIAFLKCGRCGGTHVPAASLLELTGRARREQNRIEEQGLTRSEWVAMLLGLPF